MKYPSQNFKKPSCQAFKTFTIIKIWKKKKEKPDYNDEKKAWDILKIEESWRLSRP